MMEANEAFEIQLTDAQYSCVAKVDEVDSLSTNQNKQMEEVNEEADDEEKKSVISSDDELHLNTELQAGYKILCDLMAESKKATNWPFMDSVEVSAPELYEDYKKHIEKPMWLKMMRQKFEQNQYNTITEFVVDFRLMLENCYRYNGPDHYVSKRGQKLEIMLEQKLALLPRDLREKTSIEATSGIKIEDASSGLGLRRRPKSLIPHDSTVLLNQLREAEQQKVREYRRQMILDRKAEKEALVQEINEWEDKVLFAGKYKEQMKAMWELPQIGLFLFLCHEPLNIGEIMHFELERCFLMPRESATMQLVMTSLLSTPFQRLKIDKKTLMPYKVWEQKLRMKFEQWYKVYTDSGCNAETTCSKLGLDEQFFDIVGQKNPLSKKKYHELSYYKRVWVMKGLCDYCMHTQDSLRETIELQPFPDQREYVLGTDAQGQRYIHFPQFCGADVRIYRQAPFKYPKLEIKPDSFDNKRKFPLVYKPPPAKKLKLKKKAVPVEKPSPSVSPVRQRPSRLRQTIKTVVPMQLGTETSDTEGTSTCSDDEEDTNNDTNTEDTLDNMDKDEAEGFEKYDLNDDKSEDRMSSASDATIPYCDKSDSNSSASSPDCSRESSPYPTPSDLGLRRSARLDKSSDTSRDASPLIFDSDFGLRRSSRSRARLKNIPPVRATRNLSQFLLDENSTSNSSAFGEGSISGIWKDRLISNENSRSSDTGEDSNDCDIYKLFLNSKLGKNDTVEVTGSGCKGSVETEKCSDQKEKNMNVESTSENKENVGECDEVAKNDHCVDAGVNNSLAATKETRTEGEIKEMSVDEQKDLDEAALCNGKGSLVDAEHSNRTTNGDLMNKSTDVNTKTAQDNSVVSESEGDLAEGDTTFGNKDVTENGMNGDIDNDVDNKDVGWQTDVIVGNTGKCVENSEPQENGVTENEAINSELLKGNEGNVSVKVEQEGLTAIIKSEATTEVYSEYSGSGKEIEERLGSKGLLDTDLNVSNKEYDGHVDFETKGEGELTRVKNEKKVSETEQTGDDGVHANVKKDLYSNVKIKQEKPDEDERESLNKVKTEKDEPEAETKVKKEESEEEEEEDEKVPDMSQFELLADSVEELRQLASQFAEQEPIVIKRGKKEQITRPPPRKKNVVVLHERLEFLLKELEPWEVKLQQATRRARIRLRREMEEYVEPPASQEDNWNSTDEETESGTSGDEGQTGEEGTDSKDDKKLKANPTGAKISRGNNSRSSTPVKVEEVEDFDISQRGRLRKRRIIPNNVEDQFAPKKPKVSIKSESVSEAQPSTAIPTSSQPVIIQSGKSQFVDYSDIIRQLKNANSGAAGQGVSPILIKTTQGGRTVLTSVLPIGSSVSSTSAGSIASVVQSHQNIRFISPVTSQAGKQQLSSLKVSKQHPTIQTLLSTTTPSPGLNLLKQSNPSVLQLLPQGISKVAANTPVQIQTSGGPGQPVTPVKLQLVPRQITPQKPSVPNQNIVQKPVPDQSTTPKKIAPHTTVNDPNTAGKVKYYAANASTLPINVVQQLLATRGAKLQTGPNQQSILFIPMENEGQSRNVATVSKPPIPSTQVQHQFLAPVKKTADKVGLQQKIETGSQQVKTSTQPGTVISGQGTSTSVTGITHTTPILPKPQVSVTTSPNNVGTNQPALPVTHMTQLLPVSQQALKLQNQIFKDKSGVKIVSPVIHTLGATKTYHLPPTSPPRYPTNETVRNLLDKRKSVDDKVSPGSKPLSTTTYPCIASQLQGFTPTVLPISKQVLLKAQAKPKQLQSQTAVTDLNNSEMEVDQKFENLESVDNAGCSVEKEVVAAKPAPGQQCVITSISPAKLNTLLLQTTAAGAKSIPSLIKLPSKAVLDSAVKAVVTSVSTSLPTVNIKVPSPTSLPSIGPRRNVTKTIQTMKSPIPVAPKVVTQSSGVTTLSMAGSQSCLSPQLATVAVSSTKGVSPTLSTSPVMTTQVTAIVQSIDGKKVLTKVSPQTFLTSKGLVQMGYMTPQGMMIPKLQQVGSQSASTLMNQMGLQSVKQEQPSQQLQGVQLLQNAAGMQGVQLMQNTGNQQAVQLVQNSAGQLQLIQRTSPVLQQTALKPGLMKLPGTSVAGQLSTPTSAQNLLQTIKPVIALNSSGSPLVIPQMTPTLKQNTQLKAPNTSTSPTAILPKSCAPMKSPVLGASATKLSQAGATTPLKSQPLNRNLEMKSPLLGQSANFLLAQSGSNVLKPAQSPVMTQSPVSPLLNMQQGLILPGTGLQLANPAVINPLGLNLLQPSMAIQSPTILPSSQQINLLQGSLGSAALQQMVLLNQTATSGNAILNHTSSQTGSLPSARVMSNLATVQLSKSSLPALSPTLSVAGSAPPLQMNLLGQQVLSADALKAVKAGAAAAQKVSTTVQGLTVPSLTPGLNTSKVVFQYPSVSQALQAGTIGTPSRGPLVQNVVKNLSTSFSSVETTDGRKVVLMTPKQGQGQVHQSHQVMVKSENIPEVSASQGKLVGQPPALVTSVPATIATATGVKLDPGAAARSGQAHQKLLLFSIGGQLVTGQGVPVTLSDGVLKFMPQAKVQIANQTLSPEQIQQTLSKINQVAGTGLSATPVTNPTVSSITQSNVQPPSTSTSDTVETVVSMTVDESNVPVKVVRHQLVEREPVTERLVEREPVTEREAMVVETVVGMTMDESNVPVKIVQKGLMSSPSSVNHQQNHSDHQYLSKSPASSCFLAPISSASSPSPLPQACNTPQPSTVSNSKAVPVSDQFSFSDSSPSATSTNSVITTGPHIFVRRNNKNNTQYVMKPMVYSSGYIVCPKVSENDLKNIPVVTDVNSAIDLKAHIDKNKLMADKKGFTISNPVKSGINGQTELSIPHSSSAFSVVKSERTSDSEVNDEDDVEDNLVIDEKEAALNLLTLANQALGAVHVKQEKIMDGAGDAPSDNDSR